MSDPAWQYLWRAQTLQVNGGGGQDGQTTVSFIEQIELGWSAGIAAWGCEFHGRIQGVIGGLYAGGILPQVPCRISGHAVGVSRTFKR